MRLLKTSDTAANIAEINALDTDMWHNSFNKICEMTELKKNSVTSFLDVGCQELWRGHSENQMFKKRHRIMRRNGNMQQQKQ